LQSENEELKIALAAVKSRISAMGLLYGQLQEAEDLGSVDIGEYLRRLVAALNGSLGGDHVDVEVDVDPDVPTVTHSQAVYLGILVNEVVTNSLKYAFPGGRQGRVEVSLSRLSRRRLRLAVKDDGIGFVAEQSHSLGTSMGLELSRMLAEEQLKGTYRCDSSDGVEHVMEFDLDRTEVLLS
jgi:two-component sensor histidine kinase